MASTIQINFTQESLERLQVPARSWVYYADTKTPGLRIGVGPSGHKTFYVYKKVHGRPERIKIGAFPALSVAYARTKAWELNAAIGAGQNPAAIRRALRGLPTLKELFTEYLEQHAKAKGRKSWPEMEAQFNRYLKVLGSRKLSAINKQDLERLVSKLAISSGKTTANRVVELVRAAYNWGRRKGVIDVENPALGIDKFPTHARDRFLQRAEMAAFLSAVESEDQTNRDFFLLLLLTGVRKGNLMAARWADMNLEDGLWRIDAEQSKNGRSQYVRLAPFAVELLRARSMSKLERSSFVFAATSKTGHITSPKKAWARITAKAGLNDLRPHDLRRTHASWQLAIGATLQEVGKSLNHRDIKSTLVYAHLDLDPIKRNVDQVARQMLSMRTKDAEADVLTAVLNEDC